ncbi:MAG: ADP-ribosylglycohydrolase family protein [Gemmatimonadaceae bacterium]
MIGAIAGDIIGSVFEWNSTKSTRFELFSDKSDFTDDSVLTFAVARAILDAHPNHPTAAEYGARLLEFGRAYPGRGYGGNFQQWLYSDDPSPYNSFGNGSAMRVSPVGFAFDDEATVLAQAAESAAPTHNHPEGVKGAQATALAILLARKGASKEEIRARVQEKTGYDLSRSIKKIRPAYRYDVTCQGSAPEAIIAFLDASDLESTIRNAISLGGDADTQACIAGGIAEACYGVPPEIEREVRARLPKELLAILDEWQLRGLNISP